MKTGYLTFVSTRGITTLVPKPCRNLGYQGDDQACYAPIPINPMHQMTFQEIVRAELFHENHSRHLSKIIIYSENFLRIS